MKQILGVVGSPRKNGNTDILVSKVLEGAMAEGATSHLIHLADLKIRECDGCHACWSSVRCSKNDDMGNLYPEIIKCDLLVIGTPVYWYGPTALMKGFIDRLVYFNSSRNRRLIQGKSVMTVVPFEETNMATAAPLIEFFERCCAYLELNMIAQLVVPGVSRKGEVAEREDWIAKAYELGRRAGKSS